MRRLAIQPDSLWFTITLGLLAALPSLSVDISAPTLTSIEADLGTTSRAVGLTITLFMVGFATGQFACGPLSDRYGRRPLLLTGLVSYTVAALGCSMAGNAPTLIAWRLLQGVAAGSCVVLAFAIIRDLFDGDTARVKRSYVTVVFGVAPMVAPSIGAILMRWYGWRAVYVASVLGGAALLAAIIPGLAETRPRLPPDRQTECLTPSVATVYAGLMRDRRFAGLVVVNALSYGAMFAYIAGGPIVLMGLMGLSATAYGMIFAGTAGAMALGAWTSGRCAVAGIATGTVLRAGLLAAAAASISLAVLVACDRCSSGPLLAILLVSLFCRGVVSPNAQHMALEPIREHAGTAAAAIGVVQILTGAASSAIVALLLPVYGTLGATSVMAVLGVASVILWFWLPLTPDAAAVTGFDP